MTLLSLVRQDPTAWELALGFGKDPQISEACPSLLLNVPGGEGTPGLRFFSWEPHYSLSNLEGRGPHKGIQVVVGKNVHLFLMANQTACWLS